MLVMSELGEIYLSSNLAKYHHSEDRVVHHLYLDNVHLGVLEQLGEHRDSVALNDSVGLDVVPRDDVAEGAEAGSHHGQLAAVQQLHQVGNHMGVNHTLQETRD